LRHLQVRTRDELEEEEGQQERIANNDEETGVKPDESFLAGVNFNDLDYSSCVAFANELVYVYRQEIFEILNLYGLSHESDLWCRNSINTLTGEFEDTAHTELEQLIDRTRTRFFFQQVIFCTVGTCHDNTPMSDLCDECRKRQRSIAVACYQICYESARTSEQAPILSLPWVFATPLLQNRINQKPLPSSRLLSTAIRKALDGLVGDKHRLWLESQSLKFKTSEKSFVGQATVDMTVCAFIEVLQECIGSKNCPRWSLILSRFVRQTPSFALLTTEAQPTDEWELILRRHKTNKYDEYAGLLLSIIWEETEDNLMHDCFEKILGICFEEGRHKSDTDFLNVSENIMLLLQKMAIKETII
jgi:hypothetical protein